MKEYKTIKNLESINAAAQRIESGDGVWAAGSSEHMEAFLEALENRAPELRNVTIITDTVRTGEKIGHIKNHGSFKVISGIAEALLTTYKAGDRLEFVKSTAKSAVGIVCRDFGINTLVAELRPPDENGMCKLGHFGRMLTIGVSEYEGITKKIAVINETLATSYPGALKAELPAGRFETVCGDVGDACEASIA